MHSRGDSPSPSEFETFRSSLRSLGCQYNPEDVDPRDFAGCIRPRSICGLEAINITCNAPRIERTHHDICFDGAEHYYALFQFAGQSTMMQNDQVVALDVGDIALVDSARPVTYLSERPAGQWLSLRFPRKTLASHLGLEPMGGLHRSAGTLAARVLFNLVLDPANVTARPSTEAELYMNLVIYDLIAALFAGRDPTSISPYSDKLFTRICGVIKNRFDDPEVSPQDIANELGISLRYLQKLFAARGSTCTLYIQSLRLEHAARLLRLRRLTRKGQPLNEIAFASGFLDYNNFARAFRHRFGYSPSTAGSEGARLREHRHAELGKLVNFGRR